jgi:hypothetical protein
VAGSIARAGLQALLLLSVAAQALAPGALAGQTTGGVQVTHPRLEAALQLLAAGSPTAARTLAALAESGLPVAVGTPVQLAALLEQEEGPAPRERDALLAQLAAEDAADPSMAWMVFRVAPDAEGRDRVERAWVVIEVDLIARWIHEADGPEAEEKIEADLLAILAHELIAHVGSVAATRRLEDFCDDPAPDGAVRAAEWSATLGCALEIENRVRAELNRGLELDGAARLPRRTSYALDVLNFARAQRELARRKR